MSIRCLKFPAAICLTPTNNSLIGLVIVKALITPAKITITQIVMKTAIVTSRVKLVDMTVVLLGLIPTANTPKYLLSTIKGTKTSVITPSGVLCCLTIG